jgi:hypothetical protein
MYEFFKLFQLSAKLLVRSLVTIAALDSLDGPELARAKVNALMNRAGGTTAYLAVYVQFR